MIFTKNKKLNEVLTSIYNDLLHVEKTEEESKNLVKRYKELFPKETDYNLYQCCKLLVNPLDIRDLYKNYASLKRLSDWKVLQIYKEHIGLVCRNYF